MVLAGNKAKRLSSVNHTAKTIHHHHQAIISHEDLVRLNSSPFMKTAKVFNSITLNTIFPWNFPVRHLPALFRYFLNSYHHSFLKVFVISKLILKISQSFCLSFMPFPRLENITPKSFTFFIIWYFIWSYPTSIEFCVHFVFIKIKDSILSELFNSLLISSYFNTFCKNPLLEFLNHSFQPFSSHSISFF